MTGEPHDGTIDERKLLGFAGQRFLLNIRDEAVRGFETLRWLGDELARFVLEDFCQTSGVVAEEIFMALRKRRSSRQHGLDLLLPGGSGWGSPSEFEEFEAGAERWLTKRFSEAIDADLIRQRGRLGKKAKKLVEAGLAQRNWKFSRLDGSLSVCSVKRNGVFLHSYLSAGSSGLSYWQDLASSESEKAFARESYLSMFGIGRMTDFSHCADEDPSNIASFVIREMNRFDALIQEGLVSS